MSQFAKTETRAQYLTTGGTTVQQEVSEGRTDAANALMLQTGFEREMRKAALSATVFDLGSVKILRRNGKPICEHRFSWELMFDPVDGRRGRTILVERFTADKDELIFDFATVKDGDDAETQWSKRDLAEEIRTSTPEGMTTSDHTMSEQHCTGYELWRLPIGGQPGRHVICTDHALLLDEEWKLDHFPFVFFGWADDPIGCYPVSIAAINSANQDELDGVGRRISQILRQYAIPRYIETGNTAGSTAVTQIRSGEDALGDLIQVPVGKELHEVSAGNKVGNELFQHEDRVWTRGFQQAGISEQSAQGNRPAGLNSAPAQREWNEIRQDRLSLVALQYQQGHVDGATLLLEEVKDLPEYEITIKDPNGRFLRKVKAEDFNLEDDDYVIQAYPISALPSTPTGKLAAAADLLQMQAIDRDQFMEIVKLPDLKSKLDIHLASRRAVEKIVGRMLRDRQFEGPSPRMNLGYALEYATAQWLNGIADEMPDDQLGLLNDWINQVVAMQAKAAPPAAPAPGVQGTSIAPLPPAPLAAPVPAQLGQQLAGVA